MLSDEGSRVIRALGLENRHAFEQHAATGASVGDHLIGTPYPGAFALDEKGVVIDKRFYLSYRERETGEGLLEAAFGLPSGRRGAEARLETSTVALRAYLDSPTYARAQRLHVIVELALVPDYHVYWEPTPAGMTPLALEIEPTSGVSVGSSHAPAPTPFRIAGLDDEFHVYSDNVRLLTPLTFTNPTGDLVVRGALNYQVCSATDCRPPTVWNFEPALQESGLVGPI